MGAVEVEEQLGWIDVDPVEVLSHGDPGTEDSRIGKPGSACWLKSKRAPGSCRVPFLM
jgi:hypothetical protein